MMNNSKLITYLDSIDLTTAPQIAQYLAFKVRPKSSSDTNPLTTVNYSVYNTMLPPQDIKSSIASIINIMKHTILSNEVVYTTFDPKNPKDEHDYIKLENLDFSNPNVKDGTQEGLNKDSYKVSTLLHTFLRPEDARNRKDYRGLKYSALHFKDSNGKLLLLLNKVNPIASASRHISFSVDFDSTTTTPSFQKMNNNMLKIPLVPAALIIDNYCIFFKPEVLGMFGFESYNKQVCSKHISILENEHLTSAEGLQLFKRISTKQTVCNLFATVNDEKVQKLKNRDPETLMFIKDKLGIDIDNTNNTLIINDEKSAEKILGYLCDKLFRGLQDDNIYSVSKAALISTNN